MTGQNPARVQTLGAEHHYAHVIGEISVTQTALASDFFRGEHARKFPVPVFILRTLVLSLSAGCKFSPEHSQGPRLSIPWTT